MFRISTNKTEESWARNDIKKAKPSEDSNEILERINKLSTEGMSYETAVDFFKLQLATWRRFYKEDDNVEVDEAYTADNKRVTQIKSLNIVFYVREVGPNEIKVTSGFYDTIKTSCKKLFEDLNKQIEGKDSFEMLERAKE
ncbi:MAG: hypothetical protein SPL22_00830 [Treponema sp.]|uniref:hypothetical protein n=1 Tax=Treponema sp. TaxID=166 RepID=UPI002A91B26E|nr:hypothetical protein [Treponema sp.]MDY6396249.1 hypothetical protein [Treponema sp.]